MEFSQCFSVAKPNVGHPRLEKGGERKRRDIGHELRG